MNIFIAVLIAGLLGAAFVYAEALLRLRIRLLRCLKLTGPAGLIDKNLDRWVLVTRGMVVCIALILGFIGVKDLL